jgi:hypothetical protein
VLRRTVCHAIDSATRTGSGAEVLVVVNGRGALPELATLGRPELRVLHLPQRNVALARNAILAEARHDTVMFTDDDCTVPAQWCAEMSSALGVPGQPVVTAPVRVDIAGPVSAYFDYQRLFDATPGSPDRPPLVVTANCGVRRDLLPPSLRFDPRLGNAGEDTQFGLALGAAGIPVRHLADAAPVRHAMSENIAEISERFLRNSRSGPRLFLRFGHGEAAMPGALAYYRMRIRDDFPFERRFAEFDAGQARTAFAVYDAMFAGITAAGYLDELGTEIGCRLIELDVGGLAAAWSRIAELVAERTAGLSAQQWADLSVDCRRIGEPYGAPEPLQAEVRAALRRHAAPLVADPDGRVGDVLGHGGTESVAMYLRDQANVRASWAQLRASDEPVTPDAADRMARALGLPFKIACDIAEVTVALDASIARRRAGARR